MRRLLITGGTGFFGKSILDYRLRHPDFLRDTELTVLSRAPEAFVSEYPDLAGQPGVTFVSGDVRTFSFSAFRHADFSGIIHAATAAVTTLSDDEMRSTIVDGTRHVIDFARACGVKRMLFTSSGAVYGPQTSFVDETSETLPTTAYGCGKLAAECLCVDSGVPTLIARCFAFTGPFLNRRIHYAVGNFIQDCLDGRDIVITGDGTPLRSYLYADDLVEWLFAILDRGEPARPYNVGSPHGLSILDLARTVRVVLGVGNEIVVKGAPTGQASAYVPTTARAESELGLHVTVPLEEAIRRSVLR